MSNRGDPAVRVLEHENVEGLKISFINSLVEVYGFDRKSLESDFEGFMEGVKSLYNSEIILSDIVFMPEFQKQENRKNLIRNYLDLESLERDQDSKRKMIEMFHDLFCFYEIWKDLPPMIYSPGLFGQQILDFIRDVGGVEGFSNLSVLVLGAQSGNSVLEIQSIIEKSGLPNSISVVDKEHVDIREDVESQPVQIFKQDITESTKPLSTSRFNMIIAEHILSIIYNMAEKDADELRKVLQFIFANLVEGGEMIVIDRPEVFQVIDIVCTNNPALGLKVEEIKDGFDPPIPATRRGMQEWLYSGDSIEATQEGEIYNKVHVKIFKVRKMTSKS